MRLPRLLLPLLLLAVAVAAAGAGPAAAEKRAKRPARCAPTAAKVTVGRAARCVRPGRSAATLNRVATAQLRRAARRAPKRHRKLLTSKRAERLRASAAEHAGVSTAVAASLPRRATAPRATAAAAAAGGGCAGTPDDTTTNPIDAAGMDATATVATYRGAGGAAGGVVSTTKATTPALDYTREDRSCISWDVCPDADGVLHGSFEWSLTERYVTHVDGAEVHARSIIAATADLTAHVGDDARVTSYDYVLDGRVEGGGEYRKGGRLLRHVPTEITRIHATRSGLDPHDTDVNGWRSAKYVARGPHGDRIPAATLSGLVALVLVGDIALQHQGGPALLRSEHHLNEEAACLPVVMTPGSAKVQPDERVPVRVRITDAAGKDLALPFTVTTADGTTDVTAGTSTATVTWTAPQERVKYLQAFQVRHVSRRGVADGFLEVAWADPPPRFAAELSFSHRFSWESSSTLESNVGTDSECVSKTAGAGVQQVFLDSAPGQGGTTELQDGVPVFALNPVLGTMSKDGHLTTTNTGPASSCQPASATAPTDGCDSLDIVPGVVPYVSYEADGRVTLEITGWRDPGFDGSCPLVEPEYGDVLTPELITTSIAPISLDDLKDPDKKIVTIHGSLQDSGHEDCGSEGNGGCSDDPHTARIRYEHNAWMELDWTLTLRRLEQ
ncbi:MAG TPA: hypothetical protein VFT50_03290 [Baekduia sp.]|nr:hypothetical protein [Baekduia sp.]